MMFVTPARVLNKLFSSFLGITYCWSSRDVSSSFAFADYSVNSTTWVLYCFKVSSALVLGIIPP